MVASYEIYGGMTGRIKGKDRRRKRILHWDESAPESANYQVMSPFFPLFQNRRSASASTSEASVK